MSQTTPRIPLVQPGTRPELAEIEKTIMAERGRISPLYQVLLNSEPIASGWERMLTAVRNKSLMPADLREMVIIRVAVLNKASFELHAHIPHAQKAGVDERKIDALQQPRLDLAAFTSDEAVLLRMTDAMTRDVAVPAEIMDEVTRRFDARGVLEAVTTVAAYNMVSRLLVALGIEH
ncbi:carboxymuconolactone decarboxylase family protein [Bordetella genomosp. 13]|uniref:carboxymuconolactone decarboxylase family protein n=1 Tax=Bordetella genomosp. 13 TaxID=463040 RepID=UPI0011A32C1A|nr:carboxymuconolactone decarboxylase family protein [Bordetella genomosp. 13]